MGALMVSRGVSGTVSDASEIQQQASHAFASLVCSCAKQISQAQTGCGKKDPSDTTRRLWATQWRLKPTTPT